jgi:triosephosphate isomerase
MMRRIIIAGNWKMNKTYSESEEFLSEMANFTETKDLKNVDVVICTPALYLKPATGFAAKSKIFIGAQNVSNFDFGAYTGEISAPMLKAIECSFCIIGHSERRKYFGDTDDLVNAKLKILQQNKIIPIVCIGETLEEREAGITEDVVVNQLEGAFRNITVNNDVVIAYEPVWAIGTGKTATPAQAQEIHSLIRSWLIENYNHEIAENMSILYGGSVKPDNIRELLIQPDIDGGLIGGASLDMGKMKEMINIAVEL